MSEIQRPINVHKGYHAHVYFDEDSFDFAESLCHQISTRFELKVGRVHRKPVGPHPMWSCQITFASKHFDDFISWLDEHRNGLSVLVHALTGDDFKDHTEYAYWLGNKLELNLSMFIKKGE